MIRRRQAPPPSGESSSSSDEEDAFAAMSQPTKRVAEKSSQQETKCAVQQVVQQKNDSTQLPSAQTSSMKRHHGASDSRKAKMDALFQGLEADKITAGSTRQPRSRDGFVPEKKGSFVEPGEEHLTTNIFVGNLDPSLTEEEVTEMFRQFGDLYSVKIMWPRTNEERARNRNTGFVCFMSREDAEEAMDAFSETDPFNVGRRLMMRWGKNVKKIVKRGTGGVPIAPIRKKSMDGGAFSHDGSKRRKVEDPRQTSNDGLGERGFRPQHVGNELSHTPSKALEYNPSIDAVSAVRVQLPRDPQRQRFITTVASFVAKDGAALEGHLIERQSGNPDFSFLTMDGADERQRDEHVFYRWRVFAFCQGDGVNSWRTEPFVMTKHYGRFWIPPPLNREAAFLEKQAEVEKEEHIRHRKEQRRRVASAKFMTGRQLEQAKFGRAVAGASDGGAELTEEEMKQFHLLVRKNLCASREAICEAMAFCYDKSGAAKQIANLLKETLLEDSVGISVETRIARLFLLSDVLFNSQQPGVRNAFLYRSAIEAMAPDVFTSLGNHGKGRTGRMTLNKLKNAVGSVLSAWTNWSVYTATFLDELQDRFEGKEVVQLEKDEDTGKEAPESLKPENEESDLDNVVIFDKPRGDWQEVTDHPDERGVKEIVMENEEADAAGTSGEEDIDGTQLDEDDIDGEPLEDEDVDGEPITDDEVDGDALAKDN